MEASLTDSAAFVSPAARRPWFFRSGVRPALAVELVVLAWLWWLYDAVNNLSPVRHDAAVAHAESLFRFEKLLHVDVEPALNSFVAAHDLVGSVLGNFYNVAHLLVTFVLLGWVWFRHSDRYRPLRNALVLMNLVGFVVYWLYPLAPPRLVPSLGMVDVVSMVGAVGNHSIAPSQLANEFAAMPSLHVAWALWCLVAWRRTMRSWRGTLVGVVHVTLTVLAVIGTANHYVLDVLAGGATGVFAFGVAARLPDPLLPRRRVAADDDAAARAGAPARALSEPGSR